MSLRTRLVFGAAAAVAVAIVLASGLVYFLVQSELRGQIDQNLRDNAARIPVHGIAAHYAPHVYELFSGGPPFVGYYQLVNATGDVYIPGDYITRHPLLAVSTQARAVAAGRARAFYTDTEVSGQDTRVLTFPTDSSTAAGVPADARFAIQVVESLSGVDHELAKIRLWLFLVALGGVGIASGAGFLVARSTLRPVRDLSEAAERVRATRDLSQRISVEGSDELSQLALTFNEMLAALDEAAKRQQRLVQDASHELRTPLTSLRTNIEVLAEGGALPPEERQQLLHDVVGQLGEMTALVSELTELARGEESGSGLEDVRLDLVAESAIRRTMRNHPDLSIEADLAPTRVVGSPASLERAIGNLLDNAAKWSPAGAPVEVTVSNETLTVRDHGPGIADADVPHVFERFYRADSARSMPGSGLGLAIVRQVAEAHGGTIALEQAPGGGTLMRLRLPAHDPPTHEPADPAAEAPLPGASARSDAGEAFGPPATVRGRRRWRVSITPARLRAAHGPAHEATGPRRTFRRRGS